MENNEVIHKAILEKTSFFRQVVNDAARTIKRGGRGYCFTKEQVSELVSMFDNKVIVTEDDGIYYIKKKPKEVL